VSSTLNLYHQNPSQSHFLQLQPHHYGQEVVGHHSHYQNHPSYSNSIDGDPDYIDSGAMDHGSSSDEDYTPAGFTPVSSSYSQGQGHLSQGQYQLLSQQQGQGQQQFHFSTPSTSSTLNNNWSNNHIPALSLVRSRSNHCPEVKGNSTY
jgi:hypothetical protein